MVEVIPSVALSAADPTIGQVVLKRLITAEQVIGVLGSAEGVIT